MNTRRHKVARMDTHVRQSTKVHQIDICYYSALEILALKVHQNDNREVHNPLLRQAARASQTKGTRGEALGEFDSYQRQEADRQKQIN